MPTIFRELLILAWEVARLAGCALLVVIVLPFVALVAAAGGLLFALARLAARVEADGLDGHDDWAAGPDDLTYALHSPEPAMLPGFDEKAEMVRETWARGESVGVTRRGKFLGYWCPKGHIHITESGDCFCREMRR